MMLDSLLELDNANSMTSSEASTNIVDLGSDRDVGVGRPLYLVVIVTTALDDADADETYSVALQTDDNASFSSATTLLSFSFTRGDAAGTKQVHTIPQTNERYLRLYYTLGGTTPSGAFSAYITDQEPKADRKYPTSYAN